MQSAHAADSSFQPLAQLDSVLGALRYGATGIEDELFHLPHSELALCVIAQKRTKGLCRHITKPRERNVRVESSQIGLKRRPQHRILKMLVQGKKMGVPIAHSGPEHAGTAAAERANASHRQKERRHVHAAHRVAESFLPIPVNVP